MEVPILKGDTDLITRRFPIPGREPSDIQYVEVKIEQYYWRCLDHYGRKRGFTAGFVIHNYEKTTLRHAYDWDGISDYFVDFLNGCVSADRKIADKKETLQKRGYTELSSTAAFYTNYDLKDERPPASNDT
ncbi:hypothetical protein [Salipiger thiooxidans]|uniref:hypothetical protein n=1 Tax=Salipiger thiooxidans TaxID=282683 RepID=UPI001CFA2F8F|nr:hypothetical protein [Salipiger thiooxidans]